jgi:hypothetical protein
MTIAIIVHGGASPVPAEEADAYKIVLDNEGWFGWAHNAADMPCAAMTSAMEQPGVWLRKDDAGKAGTQAAA